MMMKRFNLTLLLSAVLCVTGSVSAEPWPGWRGPGGDGISLQRGVPVKWSAASNVTWKTPMDAPADTSPIVWNDRLFLTAAYDGGRRRAVVCIDRNTGKELWLRELQVDIETSTIASPVTDGRAVYAAFGAAGVLAVNFEGRELWHADLEARDAPSGRAAAPILYRDMLIVQIQRGNTPLLVALDKTLGTTIWTRPLPEFRVATPTSPGSTATPVVIDRDDQPQLIAALPGYVAAFNPQSGREFWRCGGLGASIAAAPLIGRRTLMAVSAEGGPMIGVRSPGAEAAGLIDASHRLWRRENTTAQTGSGVIIAGRAYLLDDGGALHCIDAETGETRWTHALSDVGGGSITYIDTKLYVTNRAGATYILRAAPDFDLQHTNRLADGDTTRAAPAFSDGQIFIRTDKHLYCIGVRR